MAIHYTYKGKPIDMGALVAMNEHSVALGNANLNARGDLLGSKGVIKITAEEIDRKEALEKSKKSVKTQEPAALESAPEPKMEEFDPSLLSGYEVEENKEEPVRKTRKKVE